MIKKILFAFILLSTSVIIAQRNNSSPYSFFGLGEEFSSTTVEQSSMGGIGVAFKTDHYLNFINPAANANLRFATYGIGGLMTDLTLKESSGEQSGSATSLRYIALGFPIGDKAGFSAGLQPQSSVGYALLNQKYDADDNLTEFTRFTGTGGTSRLYGAFGIEVLKGLSLGVEASFVFGTVDNDILNQREGLALGTKNEETTRVRGGLYKVGMQYQKELSNKLQLNAGVSVQLESNLTEKNQAYLYSLSFDGSGFEIPRDTLSASSTVTTFNIPLKTNLGVGLGKRDKWYAGVNYEFQDALDNNSAIGSTYMYGESNKLAIGGFYLPKINSISSYWNRITYRAGLRFEDTGLLVDGSGNGNNFTPIKDFGINVGLGLPLGNRASNINIGLEYGQRGTTDNNLIQENYFNFRLSLSLNDIWFKKRQID
ncbi:hypothetical protein LPB136_07340 [Tenacibaculum todarodis]|uniref:Aromatic hydrocarbon degradation protein n=1 Tax=Tenacibaculum todarodis TaxID=1850252 RepID=A0A1L3JJ55_9FLAO|nr:hypothetical protein [Tenacibaculum todarodis]APG65170.1 hypothetical protein LPB136_07340 [Tenacibaculum todarodis]